MLESVLMLLKERLRVLDLTIQIQCDPVLGLMRADETRMKQVMFNLISNSAKYSRPGGVIEIGAQRLSDSELMLWVEDHGVGIEESRQHLVFDKFYRAGAVSGQQSGSGLGLSIVKSFIELHGGRVVLESVPNEGTKVTCYVPQTPKVKAETA
jgi:signal transduction histidine kinase